MSDLWVFRLNGGNDLAISVAKMLKMTYVVLLSLCCFLFVKQYTYLCKKCMAQNIFKLVLTDEAQNFIESLPEAVSYKIYYNIKRVAGGERNKELFKKLENSEIWEFRTLYNKTAYRLFAFWDKDKETLVIATHDIIKKTQKTPSKEIAKAETMRKEYFKNK